MSCHTILRWSVLDIDIISNQPCTESVGLWIILHWSYLHYNQSGFFPSSGKNCWKHSSWLSGQFEHLWNFDRERSVPQCSFFFSDNELFNSVLKSTNKWWWWITNYLWYKLLYVYKPHFFAAILGSKSWVRLIYEPIAFRIGHLTMLTAGSV